MALKVLSNKEQARELPRLNGMVKVLSLELIEKQRQFATANGLSAFEAIKIGMEALLDNIEACTLAADQNIFHGDCNSYAQFTDILLKSFERRMCNIVNAHDNIFHKKVN
jgi:hypothetical protein